MPKAVRVPRQERAQRSRASLLEAGRAQLSEHGYAGATAKTIAAAAGVSVGTFYQYFRDKDALLRELAIERFEAIAGRALEALSPAAVRDADDMDREARERFRAAVVAVADYHREDPGFHAVVTERRPHDPELDERISAGEEALVDRIGALLGQWGRPADPEATAFVLFNMVEGAVHAHCLGHAHVSDERFYEALVQSLMLVARGNAGGGKDAR
jgi:AcrR family transcriptional regulator